MAIFTKCLLLNDKQINFKFGKVCIIKKNSLKMNAKMYESNWYNGNQENFAIVYFIPIAKNNWKWKCCKSPSQSYSSFTSILPFALTIIFRFDNKSIEMSWNDRLPEN